MRQETMAPVRLPGPHSPGFYPGSTGKFPDADFELLRDDKVAKQQYFPSFRSKGVFWNKEKL